MKFLEWNEDKMGVGIEEIDEQHKMFLKIINKLSDSINTNSQIDDVSNIVYELTNYANFHFKEEEKIFEQLNYDDIDKHKNEHSSFIKKIKEIEKKLFVSNTNKKEHAINIAEELFYFTTNWLIEHIISSDKKYIQLLNKDN